MNATQEKPPQSAQPRPAAEHAPVTDEHVIPGDLPRPNSLLVVLMVFVFVLLLGGLFVLGWFPHEHQITQANQDAADQANGAVLVSLARPKAEVTSKDVVLPCDVRANQATALYARTNGYLSKWLVDIGAHVDKDQLLAVISTPDVDAQLAQAKAAAVEAVANVAKANADEDVAKTNYDRYVKAQKENPGSVTQEDVDTRRAAYEDAVSAVDVAQAAVKQNDAAVRQLEVTQGFEKITAPFAGTITARNYDVGALITVGNAGSKELFDIADTETLRVGVNVPQTYATDIHTGQPAYLTVRNYPRREFKGVVARQTGALDPVTRTLPFELDFPNSDGALYAGMYGQARLPVVEEFPTLTIPTSALIFNAQGLQVATVRDDKVHFQHITTGRDMGTEIEVTNGLTANDQVVANPGERLVDGGDVQVTGGQKPPAVAIQPPATNPSAAAN
jgi:RND family efflux transporter MFP subunit